MRNTAPSKCGSLSTTFLPLHTEDPHLPTTTTTITPSTTSTTTVGDASPGPLPAAGRSRKRRRVEEAATRDAWKRNIRQALDSAAPTQRAGETFSHERTIFEAYRVLRNCWLFPGRPQDIFEPAHHLHKAVQHLLITYGGYGVTDDGQFFFLRGDERMPYVGFLLAVLQQMLIEYSSRWSTEVPALWPHSFDGQSFRLVIEDCGLPSSDHNEDDNNSDNNNNNNSVSDFCWSPDQRMTTQAMLRQALGTSSDASVILLTNCLLNGEDGLFSLSNSLRAMHFSTLLPCGCGVLCWLPGADACSMATMGDQHYGTHFLPAVGCGSFAARTVCAHAFLLSPMGPLIIYLKHRSYDGGNINAMDESCYPCEGNGNAGGDVDVLLREPQLCEWLRRLLWTPQPTVVVQCGASGHAPVWGLVSSMLTRGSDDGGGECPSHGYRRFSQREETNESNDGSVCSGGVLNNSPVLYGRGVTVTLERSTRSPVATGTCQVWRVRVLPCC